tara:strand:- start:362 stop:736 length:375 start_codon:yes stop_codon:yes gene_type:complete
MKLSTITQMIEAMSDGKDFETDLRSELSLIDQAMENLKILKTSRQEMAMEQGFAIMFTDTENFEPKQLAPTKPMYIELHGQEAFDKVKRDSKPRPAFTWIRDIDPDHFNMNDLVETLNAFTIRK